MNRATFEIGDKGLKLPYGLFLSDSAAGYALILVVIIANLNGTPMPSWLVLPTNISQGAAILAAVPLILIGPPLGLLINGVGWFLLGWAHEAYVNRWITFPKRHPFRASSTMQGFHFRLLDECFHLSAPAPGQPRLYEQIATYDELLQVYFPDVYDAIYYVTGAKQFVRGLMLISLGLGVYALRIQAPAVFAATVIIAASLILLMLHLEVYQTIQTLSRVYIVCLEKWSNAPRAYRPFDMVVADLVGIARKSSSSSDQPALQPAS